MLLRYSFPNFLAGQDVTKITRDLNCKYMEVPSKLTPSWLTSAKNPPRGKMAVERTSTRGPSPPPISSRYRGREKGFRRRHLCSPLPNIGPIRKRSNPPSEGKWILARARNRIKRNPADRNDFDRIEARLEIYGVQVSWPGPAIYTEPRFSVNATVNLSRKQAWCTTVFKAIVINRRAAEINPIENLRFRRF